MKRIIFFLLIIILSITRNISGYIFEREYQQPFYNGFGDYLGDNLSYVYLMNNLYTDKESLNGTSDSQANFDWAKSRSLFWSRYKGMVVMKDTLRWNAVAEYKFAEYKKKTAWTPYTIKNNTLDGIFFDIYSKENFALNFLYCPLIDYATASEDDYKNLKAQKADWDPGYALMLNKDIKDSMMGIHFSWQDWTGINNDFLKIKDVGVLYVNQYRESSLLGKGFPTGVATTNNLSDNDTAEIYFKIATIDNKSDSTAAVYRVYTDSIGTITLLRGTYSENTDNNGVKYLTIDKDGYLIYKLTVTKSEFASGNFKKIPVHFLIANSYIVQMSFSDNFESYEMERTLPFDTVLYSEYGINDFSNFADKVVYVGLESANANYGFYVKSRLLGIDIDAQFYWNKQYFQMPVSGGEYSTRTYPVYILNLQREVLNDFNIEYKYYYVDPLYSTTFRPVKLNDVSSHNAYYAVLDNDDDDYETPLYKTVDGKVETFEGEGVDINRNDIADYAEDFMIINTDPPFFKEGNDYNNNDLPDNFEDDTLVDYTYHNNLKGNFIKLSYFKKGFSASLYSLNESKITVDRYNKVNGIDLSYMYKKSSFGYLKITVNPYIVKDNIENDYVDYRPSNLGNEVSDSLLYKNSECINSRFFGSFWLIKNAVFEVLYLMKYNNQKNDDRTVFNNGGIFKGKYDIFLSGIFDGIKVTPQFKFLKNVRYSTPYDYSLEVNEFQSIGAVRMDYEIGEISKIITGYQIGNFIDYISQNNSHLRKTFLVELNAKTGRITMVAGYKIVNEDYDYTDNIYEFQQIYAYLIAPL